MDAGWVVSDRGFGEPERDAVESLACGAANICPRQGPQLACFFLKKKVS